MRQQQKSNKAQTPSKKSQPIQKNKTKTKYLQYKPKKGDESKQWSIEAIVNERVILKPKPITHPQDIKQEPPSVQNNQTILKHEKVNQFEIAWTQQQQNGIWANSWEPEEHIPQLSRLDYLLKKRNELKKKKNKNSSHFKTKENLRRHIEFTMNKQKFGLRGESQEIKRNLKAKGPNKEQEQSKIKKKQSYKDWYISFNEKSRWFDLIIERFLKKEKNDIKLAKKQSQTNNSKEKIIVQKQRKIITELPFSMRTQNGQKEESLFNIGQGKNLDPEEKGLEKVHYVPKGTCLRMIKEIAYIGQQKRVDYFIAKLEDGSFQFIAQEDLLKYFPWIYEKFLYSVGNQICNKYAKTLSQLNQKSYKYRLYMENLNLKIGFPEPLMYLFDRPRRLAQFHYQSHEFKPKIFQRCVVPFKIEICSDRNLFNQTSKNNSSQIHEKGETQKNNELRQNLQKIQKYFDSLENHKCQNLLRDLFTDQPFQSLKLYQTNLGEVAKYVQNKSIFKTQTALYSQWKQMKMQIQRTKIEEKEKRKNQKWGIYPNSVGIKQISDQKKSQHKVKIQKSQIKLENQNGKVIDKNETSEIYQSNKKEKMGKQIKAKEFSQKGKKQQEQIKQILGILSYKSIKHSDEFYYSDDEDNEGGN